jgi:hypothetical protein
VPAVLVSLPLRFAVAQTAVWNRLNVATKQVAFGRIPEAAASW